MTRLWTSKTFWAAAFLIAIGVSQAPANAGWLGDKIGEFCYDYHRINCWPCPYFEPDRQHVYDMMEAQVANGWRRQNLLGAHHFDEGTSELTEAAKIKVRWILTQVPEHRRTIFVSRGWTQEITDARLAAVEQAVAELAQYGETAPVHDTHIIPEGRAAGVVNHIQERFQATQPPPQLPAQTGESTE